MGKKSGMSSIIFGKCIETEIILLLRASFQEILIFEFLRLGRIRAKQLRRTTHVLFTELSYSPNRDRINIAHVQFSFDHERHIARLIFAFQLQNKKIDNKRVLPVSP